MAKSQKQWVYSPRKPTSPKMPTPVKTEVAQKAQELIETFLKPTYVKPPPENPQFNYITDITAKWWRNYFYFYAVYAVRGPNAIAPRLNPNLRAWPTTAGIGLPLLSFAIMISGLTCIMINH